MDTISGNQYKGPVKAVILDWAGTAVDYGCFGPVAVFQAAFEAFGIAAGVDEARGPMGLGKRDHVAAMLAMPALAAQWRATWGRAPLEDDVDAVFAKVMELMPEALAGYADPVPGCREALAALRAKGIRIGSCTGYSRGMMARLLPEAERKGFKPDCVVAADEVPAARPAPWMCRRCCGLLGIAQPEAVVKVGDTAADVREGLNAGHWSVAVVDSSSGMGLAPGAAAALPERELHERRAGLERAFASEGAHFVIPTIKELPALCDRISALLAQGRGPQSWKPA